jgi:glycosyltransferase involved in cell wall biosynthesis
MDKTPLISVITINFNDRVGLERTFESVFNQTFQDFEYIVIDGGSNDGSKELIEENTGKISYWISEPDKGIYNAMNKGISAAKGDYLLFLNSGDILYKNDVLKSCETYLCNEDIISGNLSFVENERNWLGKTPETLSFYRFFTDTLYHPCSFIKKTAFDTFGWYDEEYKICSDWKWFLLAICKKKATYNHI